MKKTALINILLALSLFSFSQVSADYYLPNNITYDSAIPTPKQFFGYEPGEWHLTHDRLYFYMLELAKVSERAVWEEYGRSYENRPLGQLIVSSPENIRDLEKLRLDHVALCDPSVSDRADISGMPLVIKLGYGIHGNESDRKSVV